MKKRYWITLIGATLLVAIVVIIPLAIERYAEKWLADQGVANAAIGNIDLNLFTGTLLIESVDFSGTAEQRGQIELVALNAQWTELFTQRILVANIAIAGAQLDVLQLDDGRYLLGGLTIPLASTSTEPEPEPEPDVTKTESAALAWGFGLDNVSIDNLQVTYRDKRLHSRLAIDQVTLDRLASWEPERRSEISAKLNLDGAAISLHSSVAPFAPAPSATSSLSVAELQLLPYATLFEQLGLADLSGAVSIDLSSNAHREEAGAIGLDVSGSARLDDLAVTLPTARVSNRQLSWSGELAATLAGADAGADAAPQVSGSMQLAATAFTLVHPERPLRLVEFDKLALEGVLIKSLDLIEIGGLSIHDLSMLSSADATTLSIANAQLNAIGVTERAKLTVNRAVFNDMLGLVERDTAGNLEPTTTILSAFSQPSTSTPPTPAPSPAPAAGDNQTAAAEPGTTENAFTFNFSVLEIGGNSLVRVIDRSVSPPLTTQLKINTLRLTEVRNDDPTLPMHVQFDIQQDNSPTLTGEGDLWLFGEKPASDLQVAVHSFDLPQISSYVPGYHIDRGRLSINTHVTLKDDKLDITNDLTIEKLKLSGKAAGNQKLLGQGMAMPLDVALDLLRDGDDRIKLQLPISGSINDPKFETADVFQTIIQSALQKTAMNYVKTALQPLGTIMMVTKIAGKAARPRFEPVVFEQGKTQLNAKGRAYLDKIAKLLAERPGLSITLCGVSTQTDHDYLLAQMPPLQPEFQSEVQPPAPASAAPDFATERMELATARGDTTLDYLANSGNINTDRLYRCRPTLEANADQPPRVEITL